MVSRDPDDVMIRRREKRRHVTPNAVDLRDPYSVIALAIRLDEAMAQGDESLLLVPLETGRIYNHKAFSKALAYLQRQTSPRQVSSSSLFGWKKETDPPQAITPVILSGLLAAIQERPDTKGPTSVELVSYCRNMRRAALNGVRLRNERRRVQRVVTPVVLFTGILFMLLWSTTNVRSLMIEYGFVETCGTKACRLADARLWEYINPSRPLVVSGCTMDECSVADGQREYPVYAMHTYLNPAWLPLSEIENPRQSQKLSFKRSSDPFSKLQWLGETTTNRLVRETILSTASQINVLDVGCGIGSTLYALLGSNLPEGDFTYHGISISTPEITQAQRLIQNHGVDTFSNIEFRQQSFDEPLGQTYSSMVAVESLSYSPSLPVTLKNLASSLQSNGILVVVDDVLTPWASQDSAENLRNLTGKPSLSSHQEWTQYLTAAGFKVVETIDLGLEMDMAELIMDKPEATFWDFLGEVRDRMAQFTLEKWKSWFGEGTNVEQKASLRTIQLIQDLATKLKADLARQEGYRNVDLSYYFYVCLLK